MALLPDCIVEFPNETFLCSCDNQVYFLSVESPAARLDLLAQGSSALRWLVTKPDHGGVCEMRLETKLRSYLRQNASFSRKFELSLSTSTLS